MRLLNSTDFSGAFLRRMVSWCCQEIELSPRCLKQAKFRNRATCAYSGHAWGHRIVVSIGPDSKYPVKEHKCPGYPGMSPRVADRIEALVAITAHELTHVREFNRRGVRMRSSERQTMYEQRR